MVKRLIGALMVVAVATAGVAVHGTSAALAAPGRTVTLPGTFRDMLVDPLTGRVFVAAGDVVAVYEPDGTLVATVPDQLVASGLAIDGDDVYVSLATSGVITRISTATLAVTGSWMIGRPLTDAIAFGGGYVWFVTPEGASYGDVGKLDPASAEVTLDVFTDVYSPMLRTSPTRPGELYVGRRGLSPASILRWDVTQSPPAVLAVTGGSIGSNLRDFRLSPDGNHLTSASGSPYHFEEVDADTLELTGRHYEGSNYPIAIAYSADGRVQAGGTSTTYSEAYVHEVGQPTGAVRVPLGFDLAARGLGLAPDGSWLYAASETTLRIEQLGEARLDVTWSGDGVAGLTRNEYRVSLAALDSSRLFVASYNRADRGAFRLTRYEADGQLGRSFGGGDGVLQRRFAPGTTAVSFPSHIVRTGSKFVVVGDHYDGRERLGILRMSTSGGYDATFSGDGRVLYRIFPREHDLIEPWKVQVLDGGKIAIALAAFDDNGKGELVFTEQAFVRLNANGTLDSSFHSDGIAVVSKDTSDVTFLPNGALYAGRELGTTHEIRKLTPSGTPDLSFSGDGRASVTCGSHHGAYLQADTLGRPLMACRRDLAGSSWDFLLTRFTPSGAVDSSYGGGDGTSVLTPTGNDLAGGFLVEAPADGTFWLATRSASDESVLDLYSLDASGDPNPGWGVAGAHIDVGFTVQLNRMAIGGGRAWVALQKSATVTALTALVRGVAL